MAISFVGSAENSAIDGSDVTLTLPAMQQDDLVIVAYAVGDNDNINHNLSMVTAGYSELADLFADDTRDCNLGVFYKFMGATPDTTAVVDGIGGTDAAVSAVCIVFRGVDLTTPFDVTSTTATGINTMHPNPPSINHLNPTGLWTAIAGASATNLAAGTYTFPTNYTTNAVDISSAVDSSNNNAASVGMGYRTSPADPEDPGVITRSGTDNVAFAWCACTMALRPAAAGGVTVTPGVAALTTARFAPSVLTPRLVTPGLASLITSLFAPAVTIGVRVIPGAASLVTSLFAPTVLTPRLVTPGTLALVTTLFAPSVVVNTRVVPGVLALISTSFAPTVLTPRLVTPGTVALTTALFAPAVLTPRLVTPGVLALLTTLLAPTVTASSGEIVVSRLWFDYWKRTFGATWRMPS